MGWGRVGVGRGEGECGGFGGLVAVGLDGVCIFRLSLGLLVFVVNFLR